MATMDIIVIKDVFNCITVSLKTIAIYLIFSFCIIPAIKVAIIIIIPGVLIQEKLVVDVASPLYIWKLLLAFPTKAFRLGTNGLVSNIKVHSNIYGNQARTPSFKVTFLLAYTSPVFSISKLSFSNSASFDEF